MNCTPTRYAEVQVEGTPSQMGRQIGESTRDQIRGFVEIALTQVNKMVGVSRDRALSVAQRCISHVADYSADMLDELRGMSESSGVSLDELMLLQVRNQLVGSKAESACTSFSAASFTTESGKGIVGQNWDNDPMLDEFTIVLTRRPVGKPALMTVTQAGLIAYIGMNDEGIGCCLNTLPAPSREFGVPHYFTLRGIYESTSLDQAVHAIRRAQRAIPANIMMIAPQGSANLEITIDDVHVLRSDDSVLTHTNHCLHPQLRAINDDFPELIQSRPRLDRIRQQISDFRQPLSIKQMKSLLCDHAGHPRSVCRHTNDDPQHGYWTTVLSVLIQPDAQRMHVARGTPCDHPYETYKME